jgi:hypothetical protein
LTVDRLPLTDFLETYILFKYKKVQLLIAEPFEIKNVIT